MSPLRTTSGVFATMPWRSTSVMAWASLSDRPNSCAIWRFDRFTPHEIRAQYPGRDWLMMSGKNGSRQIIEAILAGLAQVSLSVPLAIVMAIADHSCAAAVEADNAVRPAELTNDFIALRLVEQVRQLDQVHHGSRSLPHRERPTDQLPDQDQHPEILPRAGGSLPACSPSPRNPTRALNFCHRRWK